MQIGKGAKRRHVLELRHDAGRGQASFRLPNNSCTLLRGHSSETQRGDYSVYRLCFVNSQLIEQIRSIALQYS